MTGKGEGSSTEAAEKVALSVQSLFSERDETYELLSVITNDSSSIDEKDASLIRLRRIFDKYLECPTLLDQDVGNISTLLMQAAKKVICSSTKDGSSVEFKTCAHSLSVLYVLSKVRGRKNVQKFLSHEVEDVEPILSALKQFVEEDAQQKSLNDTISHNSEHPQRWESLFMLWNWMGALSLVPFDCTVVLGDSSLVSTLITLGKNHLSASGPTRDASASCLASWLARPDLESTELPKFVAWSSQILLDCSQKSQTTSVFLVLGVMQTLVSILKVSTSPRETIQSCLSPLWEQFILLAESNVCDTNLLLRKYMVKWWSRMGCVYLPPRVATWRYQRGRRSLAENLHQQSDKSTSNDPSQSIETDNNNQNKRTDTLMDVSDHVEDAMGFILEALSDRSTTVRWPAAKGVGRLTERLPSICADDVLDAILELFANPEADQAWHGACLALAELARRGLLLPNRLSEVVPLVVRAIQYDIRRGQSSVGSHVRDAACYTYWSFARAYEPLVLEAYVTKLSESIILTCLFDREVNCRRAASAAFQECVGRQGADNFKHGISILTHADYFALGNRNESFTSISLYVAQFPEYQRKIIDHVYKIKLRHWDEAIRRLSSNSLYGLASLDPAYIIDAVVPSLLTTSLDPKDIPVRHGSILGLAESIAALGNREDGISEYLPDSLLQEIAEIVPTIERKRLYRGRGGEMIRGAVCRLITCICVSRVPLVAKQQVRLLDSIDACLPHPNETIQLKACEALDALTNNYFPVGPTGPSDRLQKRVVDKYLETAKSSENPASTRGFSLALGHLPKKLLAPSTAVLEGVLNTLCKLSHFDAKLVGNEKDAETRRNSLIALRRVCRTVGLTSALRVNQDLTANETGLNSKQISNVFEAFFLGLDDYNIDRRGDVGSWCRIEAMKGLEAMASLVVEQASKESLSGLFKPSIPERIIGGLLKQFSEKLDNARVEAGNCLQRILSKRDPEIPFIPEKGFLVGECLGLVNATDTETSIQHINWADASLTFPMVAKAASEDAYFPFIISGMIISVGGLTESVAKHSNAALLQLAKQAKGSKKIADVGATLLELFKTHSRDARVILPLLKTLDILVSHRCLDDLMFDETSAFRESLLELLTKEARNCGDVHRLFACIDVALGIVSDEASKAPPGDGEHDKSLTFACSKLLHPFPRVRRYAAEHIYVCLLEHPDLLVVKRDFDLESLLNFPWDDPKTTANQCREKAQTLADAIPIPLPSRPRTGHAGQDTAKSKRPVDDFASYAALVDSAS